MPAKNEYNSSIVSYCVHPRHDITAMYPEFDGVTLPQVVLDARHPTRQELIMVSI
jgi:hypothetical protein